MTGYGGYFLQGLSSGLQSGFNMGQMKWQQNEKKKLAKKQDEMLESATIYNSMVAQLGEDGVYSDDDMMKINTAYMALGYDVKERVDGTYKAIQAMDKRKVDQNYQWFEMLPSILEGVDPSDAQGIIDAIRPNISGEKGLLTFEALTEITRKKNEAAQKKPEDIWGQAGTLPQDIRPDYLRSKGIDIPQPVEAPADLTVADKKYNWAIDNYKAGKINFEQLSQFMGTSIDKSQDLTTKEQEVELMKQYGATTEEIKNKLLGTGGTETAPETVSTLKNWEEMFNIKTEEGPKTEEEYNRALDLLAQSEDKYKPKYANWKEALTAEAKGIAKELEGITDKKDYNLLLNIYMQKLEEIKAKYPEVDLNQFPEFKENKNWFDKLKEKVGL